MSKSSKSKKKKYTPNKNWCKICKHVHHPGPLTIEGFTRDPKDYCTHCGHRHPKAQKYCFCTICKSQHPKYITTSYGQTKLGCKQACLDCLRRIVKCKTCRRCSYCNCICGPICEDCQRPYSNTDKHYCRTCSRCRSICECKQRRGRLQGIVGQEEVGKFEGGVLVGSRLINPLHRSIGLEIELAQWGTMANWREIEYSIARDGSVEPSGQEMVIAPAAGDKFVDNLFKLGQALLERGATVNKTCGLHVHIDAQDLGWWDIRKLMLIWLGIEPDLCQKFVHPNRIGNRFCKLMGEIPGRYTFLDPKSSLNNIKREIFKMLYEADPGIQLDNGRKPELSPYLQYKRDKYGNHTNRYYNLNIHSWLYRGTVEFRFYHGTTNGIEIMNWALLCGWIVQVAQTISLNQAISIFHGGMNALKDILHPNPIALNPIKIIPENIRNYITERMNKE